ncbi:hypothetical protein [Brevundimonas sp. CEF1]|uniref:hypothetical protein n=1 Tax=Brevundimonas sp. CEF1 TaxID=3442642 RepID=UPI003F51416B
MAKLPQALDMQRPNGAMSSGQALDFSSLDRALQGAAKQVERFDEARRAADDKIAGHVVSEFANKYTAAAAERWAAYDGRTAGQDTAEMALFDADSAPLLAREDLPDGVREAVRRQVSDLRQQTLTRVTATASQMRAERFASDRDANENAAAQRLVQDGMVEWQETEAEIRRSGADLTAALMPAWDGFVEKMLQPHPPAVRQRAAAIFERQRGQLVMGALREQEANAELQTRQNSTAAASQFVNRVRRDPALLANGTAELGEIAASLPHAARSAFITEWMQKAGAAQLEARIEGGQADAVEADIAAGHYDGLPPSVLEAARASVKHAQSVMTEEKAFAIANAQARHLQNLAAIARGEEADDSVIAEARGLVKPEELVGMLAEQQEAVRLRPFIQDMRKMDAAQAELELQRLEGLATTQAARNALAAVRREKDADFGLRGTDPAAWAQTPAGRSDRMRTAVAAAWANVKTNPTPAAAQDYAARALSVQAEAGIADANRRLIDRATARDMVAGLDAPGVDVSANIRRLAQFADAFGPHRARVMVELSRAGMTPRATGALMHYADQPQVLERYAAGLAATPTSDEKQRVEREMRTVLGDYERTMASGVGLDATKAAVRTAAFGSLARGENVADAVKAAADPIIGDWAYGKTFAVPRSAGVSVRTVEMAGNARLRRVMENDLSGLRTPVAPGYTREQSQRRWRDVIEQGDWVTKPDETGIIYMIDLGRGPEPLVQKNGTPLEMPWSAATIEARATRDQMLRDSISQPLGL